MNEFIHVVAYGSLCPDRARIGAAVRHPLGQMGPVPLPEVLATLGIAAERVQLAMVNHRAVARTTAVSPGDRVALFPPEYPFFADWKDLR
jgi:molybdopterin converting factor small subunit